jgi:hypothetical protein
MMCGSHAVGDVHNRSERKSVGPWYNDPTDLTSFEPGQVIRTRTVQTRVLGIPFPVDTEQLLFRSNDVYDNLIVTATSVITPGIPWTGGPRPVVSFQEAIDSTDSACNPSYTLQTGTMKESLLVQYWLLQGFEINVPDFDGKFNTFNTFDEGKMVLDSLWAMKSDAALGLTNSGIALYGYSGGGSGSMRAISDYYQPDKTLEAIPEVMQVLREQSLGQHIPDSPIFWRHGMWDELIPPSVVLRVVDEYWNRGADLRFYTMPLPEHITNAVVGWPPAVAWTSAILRGLPPGPRLDADFQIPGSPALPGS